MATMKFVVFVLSLCVGFHVCSCDPFDDISNEVTQAQRRPRSPPPRSLPPRLPPPRSLPPRSPPPRSPPRRSPPPRSPLLPPAISPCPPSTQTPHFDHFIFTLTWPNAFCKLPNVVCSPSPPTYYTIHGLWPVNNFHNAVSDCGEQAGRRLTEDILDKREASLLKYWPSLYSADKFRASKKFWRSQWCKHGSCSSNTFTPADYFDKAIALGSKYSHLIKKRLEDNGIRGDGRAYPWGEIVKAIEGGGDINVRLSCKEDASKKLQLTEIQICFDSNAQTPKKCNRPTTGRCKTNLVFASPPPPPPPPPPPRSLET